MHEPSGCGCIRRAPTSFLPGQGRSADAQFPAGQVFPKFPRTASSPSGAGVSFDDRLGQRQGNKSSSSRPKTSDPQFAQPCAFANVPETTREHRHPLLVPRSLVRIQHIVSEREPRLTAADDLERPRDHEGPHRTKNPMLSAGTEGVRSADGCGLRELAPHRLLSGSTKVNSCICRSGPASLRLQLRDA